MKITIKGERDRALHDVIFDERLSLQELVELLEEYVPLYGQVNLALLETRQELFDAIVETIDLAIPDIMKKMENLHQ